MMNGGKVSIADLKEFIDNSYAKKPKDFKDFVLDKQLSSQRVKVYIHPQSKQAYVVHRGTASIHDVGNDLKMALGFDISGSKRVKHAKEVQKKTEKKYGKEKVTTIGHSLGAKIASDVGQDSKSIINLNKAVIPSDLNKTLSSKETNIRSKSDLISILQPFQKKGKSVTIEIPALELPSPSPSATGLVKTGLQEHKSDILERLDQDKMVGKGCCSDKKNKMNIKQLKEEDKKIAKERKVKYLIGNKKKGDFKKFICGCDKCI
jgi:hypothetical protein